MKKNWILRLGVLAMVLTLVTMPLVSSTYAKYVTSATGSDTARVAKWGVTATVTGGAFAKEYTMDDADAYFTNSVLSSTADKLVAPGTNGTFTGIDIFGIPEVAVNIAITPVLTLTGWTLSNGTYYCPVVITVNDTDYKGYNYESAALFKAAVEAAIVSEGNYAAKTDLSDIDSLSGNYAWTWAYETNDDVDAVYTTGTDVSTYYSSAGVSATGTYVHGTTYYSDAAATTTVDTSSFVEAFTYDQADTYLGNLVSLPEISLGVTATVTQID